MSISRKRQPSPHPKASDDLQRVIYGNAGPLFLSVKLLRSLPVQLMYCCDCGVVVHRYLFGITLLMAMVV